MALTIQQIQTKIDSQSLDARQLINLIADYLQANPDGGITPTLAAVLAIDNDANGLTIENLLDPTTDQQAATKKYVDDNSGGASGIDDVLAIGQALAGDRIVDLDANILSIKEGANAFLEINPTQVTKTAVFRAFENTGAGNYASLDANASPTNVAFSIYAIFDDGNVIAPASITGTNDGANTALAYTADTHTFNGKIINPELVAADFADDTAAGVGGIAVGGLYHTAGVVKVRLA